MTQKDLKTWKMLVEQVKNGYHLSGSDILELKQLNMIIMEHAHYIHNESMLGGLK